MSKYRSPFSIAHRKPIYISSNDPRAYTQAGYEKFASRAGADVVVEKAPNIQIQSGTAGDYREPPEYSNAFNGGYFYVSGSPEFIIFGEDFFDNTFDWPVHFYGTDIGLFNYETYFDEGLTFFNPNGEFIWAKLFPTTAFIEGFPTPTKNFLIAFGRVSVNSAPPYNYNYGLNVYKFNANGLISAKTLGSLTSSIEQVGSAYDSESLYLWGYHNTGYIAIKIKNDEILWTSLIEYFPYYTEPSYIGDQLIGNYGVNRQTICANGDYVYSVVTVGYRINNLWFPGIIINAIDATTGELRWSRRYNDLDDPDNRYASPQRNVYYDMDTLCDTSGNVYIKAQTYDNGANGVVIFKVSPSGNLVWSKKINAKTSESAGFAFAEDGNIVFSYNFWIQDYSNYKFPGIIKLNKTTGSMIYAKEIRVDLKYLDGSENFIDVYSYDGLNVNAGYAYLGCQNFLLKTYTANSNEWAIKYINYKDMEWETEVTVSMQNSNNVVLTNHTNIDFAPYSPNVGVILPGTLYYIDATDVIVEDANASQNSSYNILQTEIQTVKLKE